MAIISQQTAPNFATGEYHRILKVELLCSPSEPVPRYHIMVGFYASETARQVNPQPMYVNSVFIPFDALSVDPRESLYELLLQTPLFQNVEAKSDIVT